MSSGSLSCKDIARGIPCLLAGFMPAGCLSVKRAAADPAPGWLLRTWVATNDGVFGGLVAGFTNAPLCSSITGQNSGSTRSISSQAAGILWMWPSLVWSGSPHVGKVLGWDEGTDALRIWPCEHRHWPVDKINPPDPRSALKRAMRLKSGSPNPWCSRNSPRR